MEKENIRLYIRLGKFKNGCVMSYYNRIFIENFGHTKLIK